MMLKISNKSVWRLQFNNLSFLIFRVGWPLRKVAYRIITPVFRNASSYET